MASIKRVLPVLACLISGGAAAQGIGNSGMELTQPLGTTTAERIEILLSKSDGWQKDGKTWIVHEETIRRPGSDRFREIVDGAYWEYRSPDGRLNATGKRLAQYNPTPSFLTDCNAALDYVRSTRFSPDVRKALGIRLRTYDPVDGYVIFEQGSDRPTPINPILAAAEAVDYRHPSDENNRYEAFLDTYRNGGSYWGNGTPLQTAAGFCIPGAQSFTVRFEFSVSADAAATASDSAGAPKRRPGTIAPPVGGTQVLTIQRPRDAPLPAPARAVHKPGEAPRPPEAPKAPPCPTGMSCATPEGAPLTAEGRAYMAKLEAFEAEKRAYEEREAAARAAVADLNRKNADAYAAQLRAEEQRQADAKAARDAKIAADQATYQAQLRAHREESERLQRDYETQMAEWRRRKAECLAGDRSKCAQPDP